MKRSVQNLMPYPASVSRRAVVAGLGTFLAVALGAVQGQAQLPFADNFDRADSTDLGANWTEALSNSSISANQLAPQAGVNTVATVNGVSVSDVVVSVDVDLIGTAPKYAGPVARYSGPGQSNHYHGLLTKTSDTTSRAMIFRNLGGSYLELARQDVVGTSGTLRFEVVGSSLELYLNNVLVASATDTTISGPGKVGVRSMGVNMDHFAAAKPADTDGDGMPDKWEAANGLNAAVDDAALDPDTDGLTNLQEYNGGNNSTNPQVADTDGDGMPDGWERTHSLNPRVNDAGQDPDGDSSTNLQEYNGGVNSSDPRDSDSDNDTMPDGWERTNLLNPNVDDRNLDPDSDGLTNVQEYNGGVNSTNPRVGDTDGDGMPDKWEVDNGLNPNVDDAADDADSDGLTNLGEYNETTNPNDPDHDGDGMPDGFEVLYRVSGKPNPKVADADDDLDSDGLTNLQEWNNGNNSTNPNSDDSDGDGLKDKWELDNGLNPNSDLGIDGANGDPDNDGESNLDEQLKGTNPRQAPVDTSPATNPNASGGLTGVVFAQQIGQEGAVVPSKAMAPAEGGGVYVAGTFTSSSATFKAIDGTDIALNRLSGRNGFVGRQTATGLWEWVVPLRATNNLEIRAVASFAGHVYVAGYFYYGLDYDGTNVSSFSAPSGGMAFVTKVDVTDQSHVWTHRWSASPGSSSWSWVNDIAVNDHGVFVCGEFHAGVVPQGSGGISPRAGSYDLFIANINDSNGGTSWVRYGGSSGSADQANAVAVNAAGESFLAGIIGPSSTFGAGSISPNNESWFVAKFSSNGTYSGANYEKSNSGGSRYSAINDLATFGGLVYAVGDVKGQLDSPAIGNYDPNANERGLLGQYINWRSNTKIFERVDEQVNFDWGSSSPDSVKLPADGFMVTWDGNITIPGTSGSVFVTFETSSDDGVILWVNNSLVIWNWTDHAETINSGGIWLTRGQSYPIRLWFYENGGRAVISLKWSMSGRSKEVIPKDFLSIRTRQPFFDSGSVTDGFVLKLLGSDLTIEGTQAVRGTSNDTAKSIAIDSSGSPYVSGEFNSPKTRFASEDEADTVGAYELFRIGSNRGIYYSKLDPNLIWQWTVPLTDTGSFPSSVNTGDIAVDASDTRLYGVGDWDNADLVFGSGSSSIRLNHTSGGRHAYLTAFDTETGRFKEIVQLEIISPIGAAYVEPGVGVFDVFKGSSFTATVPAQIFMPKAEETFLPDLVVDRIEEAPSDTSRYSTRYTALGYTVGDGVTADTGNRFEFKVEEDTVVRFNWKTEHKMEVFAEVIDRTSIATAEQEEAVRALGNPTPAVGTHWFEELSEISPSVEGAAISLLPNEIGTRYIVEEYLGTGSAPTSSNTFKPSTGRIQVGSMDGVNDFFQMNQPSTLTYRWRRQFQLTVNTTSDRSRDLPVVQVINQFQTGNMERAFYTFSGSFPGEANSIPDNIDKVSNFAVRPSESSAFTYFFHGSIEIKTPGDYDFTVEATRSGVKETGRLWIDNLETPLIDNQTGPSTASINLPAGFFPIKAQFLVDNTSSVNNQFLIKFKKSSDPATIPVPNELLYPRDLPTPQENAVGSGDFWFHRGSRLRVGGIKDDAVTAKSLEGWFNGTGHFLPYSQFPSTVFPDLEIDDVLTEFDLDVFTGKSETYQLKEIDFFDRPTRVMWNYGDTIHYLNVAIGESVPLDNVPGNFKPNTPPAAITLIDSPPGSTINDMQIWDDVANKSYPLRPGRFMLEWEQEDTLDRVFTHIAAGFPGESIPDYDNNPEPGGVFPGNSHYRHVAETPDVDLDPSDDDEFNFLGLQYITGDAQVFENQFSATRTGKTVLVFSVSPNPNLPAVGDLTRETLRVRVAETKLWNAVSGWNGSTAPLVPLIGQTAEIGTAVTSPMNFDADLPGKGFLKFAGNANYNALYNRFIYDAKPAPTSIIPVNYRDSSTPPTVQGDAVVVDEVNDLLIVWYEIEDGIQWPYQPEAFTSFDWPTKQSGNLNRIVIASRLGSEGAGYDGDPQLSFNTDFYEQTQIYNQPNRDQIGYNANEEHAIIAPSYAYADSANRPPTAYALRNDLNISRALIAQSPNHTLSDFTSDPYVLVQYFDIEADEWKMSVYAIELEDPTVGLDISGDTLTSKFEVKGLSGFISDLDVNLDIANTSGTLSAGLTSPAGTRVQLFTGAGGAGTDFTGLTLDDSATEPLGVPFMGRFDPEEKLNQFIDEDPNGEWILEVSDNGGVGADFKVSWSLSVQTEDNGALELNLVDASQSKRFLFPYVFQYNMKAGEPIVPLYPLNVVIGASPCKNGVDASNVPLDPPNGTTYMDGQPTVQRTYWEDHKGFGWAVSGDSFLYARYFYPLRSDFWYPDFSDDTLDREVGDCVPFLPDFKLAAGKLGAFANDAATRQTPKQIQYNTKWPPDLPILKIGETLTFAGGEFRADNPAAKGLPGIIGWSAGQVVFDTMNPTVSNDLAVNEYVARMGAPLLDRTVNLSFSNFPESLQPATQKTKVVGTEFRFEELPASLKKRVYYDFLTGKLGVRGFIADRAIGDTDLTAAPPPLYVLEPNILTDEERLKLRKLAENNSSWTTAVDNLYKLSRNPAELNLSSAEFPTVPGGTFAPYLIGLQAEIQRDSEAEPRLDANFDPVVDQTQPELGVPLGPGLALFANQALLDPANNFNEGYITLAENNHPDLGAAPVSIHIIKLEKNKRYRGAIKTILSDNVFDEKITLRHSGDFGAMADDLIFQWWVREEDGTEAPLPTLRIPDPWQLFGKSGAGKFQVDFEGTGEITIRDNLFFLRYRHKDEVTVDEIDWTGSKWEEYGSEWAGAANSPDVDGNFRPQLVIGWIKRVLDAVNPYEARIRDFSESESPATYASMIQQFGPRYEGQVALNPDKNVIENVGLIELYQTILNRASDLTINLSQPANSPGVVNALLLAATRISEFYTIIGHEAYTDAKDPTIGFGSDSVEYGSLAPTVHAFQNQLPTLLDEELALMRGVDDTFGRPVYNRLFWNYTKDQGEVAYANLYNITDVTQDGLIDELDAQRLFPQGHGDAWGHYLTAVKGHYDLLRHPFFNWISRSELYNLQDVVFKVDYLDERRFAQAAAAKAQTGKEIVDLTYRSHYVEDPAGQWQGYTDIDADRAWGVTGWAKRAGQGAYFDWVTANALIPAEEIDPTKGAIETIDRSTVTEIATISANLGEIQSTYDDANDGLNPLGLNSDVVTFDLDPTFNEVGSTAQIGRVAVQGMTHFVQIYERALAALNNAKTIFNHANQRSNMLRQVANTVEGERQTAIEQDIDYRNRLIEIFGGPYEGTIGPGRVYPPGYSGPDLMLFMYVDVREVTSKVGDVSGTVPNTSAEYTAAFNGFKQYIDNSGTTVDANGNRLSAEDDPNEDAEGFVEGAAGLGEFEVLEVEAPFDTVFLQYFVNDGFAEGPIDPSFFSQSTLKVDFPTTASGYTFQAPSGWGIRRSPGQLQSIISELVQTEAQLAFALSNYEAYVEKIKDMTDLLEAKHNLAAESISIKTGERNKIITLNAFAQAAKVIERVTTFLAETAILIAGSVSEAFPTVLGFSNDATSAGRASVRFVGVGTQVNLRIAAQAAGAIADILEADKDRVGLNSEIDIMTEGFKFEIAEMLQALEQELRNEVTARLEIFTITEHLRQISDQYRAKLTEGVRLIDERTYHNQKIAATAQKNRYQDMLFRLSRNDALQKYDAAFNLAQRYVYLASKAYDYETNLAPNDRGAAQGIFTDIIRARDLGVLDGSEPVLGHGGLADAMALMRDNFDILGNQMGFHAPQLENSQFSLRKGAFRIPGDPGSDALWAQKLNEFHQPNLWDVPEFRRFCRPFAPREEGPQPGLVIPFSTEVKAGRNFFGWPLGGGDNAYDPTVYSTKIGAVGAWFENYDTSELSLTPRVYLVPAGLDVLTIPTSNELETRVWNVVDQSIPVPHNIGLSDLRNPDWIPAIDSLAGPMGDIRRYSSFRAFPVGAGGEIDLEELTLNNRLIGRSVWNTQWLLIIPGVTLQEDAEEGLKTLINGKNDNGDGITDINFYFLTYGFSGN